MIDFSTELLDHDVRLVRLSGEMDTKAAEYFFSCMEEEVEQGHTRVIIDCGALQFVSSMGMGMIMRSHGRMKKRGGDVKLANLQGRVAELFGIVGFDQVLHMYPTVDEALASFEEAG